MSNIKVESCAVETVKKLINNSDIITDEEIKEGDKAISLDGFITIYTNKKITKNSFLNKIDIQVKGRTVKKLSTAKNLKFSMSLLDINNYKKVGGAILFLVQITEDRQQQKIYIKTLLPYEINQILEKKSSGNISLIFESIDVEESETFEMICFQFLNDKNKQYSFREKTKV